MTGGLDGGLAVWRLGAEAGAGGSAGGEGSASGGEEEPPHDEPAPRAWRPPAVARWLQEYITRAPGQCHHVILFILLVLQT